MTNLLRSLLHKHAWLLYYPSTGSKSRSYSTAQNCKSATSSVSATLRHDEFFDTDSCEEAFDAVRKFEDRNHCKFLIVKRRVYDQSRT